MYFWEPLFLIPKLYDPPQTNQRTETPLTETLLTETLLTETLLTETLLTETLLTETLLTETLLTTQKYAAKSSGLRVLPYYRLHVIRLNRIKCTDAETSRLTFGWITWQQ